ncbi:MAG: hypothetical protein Q9187_000792 [Circinaria calcarea]
MPELPPVHITPATSDWFSWFEDNPPKNWLPNTTAVGLGLDGSNHDKYKADAWQMIANCARLFDRDCNGTERSGILDGLQDDMVSSWTPLITTSAPQAFMKRCARAALLAAKASQNRERPKREVSETLERTPQSKRARLMSPSPSKVTSRLVVDVDFVILCRVSEALGVTSNFHVCRVKDILTDPATTHDVTVDEISFNAWTDLVKRHLGRADGFILLSAIGLPYKCRDQMTFRAALSEQLRGKPERFEFGVEIDTVARSTPVNLQSSGIPHASDAVATPTNVSWPTTTSNPSDNVPADFELPTILSPSSNIEVSRTLATPPNVTLPSPALGPSSLFGKPATSRTEMCEGDTALRSGSIEAIPVTIDSAMRPGNPSPVGSYTYAASLIASSVLPSRRSPRPPLRSSSLETDVRTTEDLDVVEPLEEESVDPGAGQFEEPEDRDDL